MIGREILLGGTALFPTEKPSVSGNVNTVLVSGLGHMTPDGYVPENAAHTEVLTEIVDGRRIGRSPLEIPVTVLTAAGHGPRRTRAVVSALGDIPLVDDLRRHGDLRRQCLDCAENIAEVRKCAVIDCPVWPYRMGRNPHNPRRGIKPFPSRNAGA